MLQARFLCVFVFSNLIINITSAGLVVFDSDDTVWGAAPEGRAAVLDPQNSTLLRQLFPCGLGNKATIDTAKNSSTIKIKFGDGFYHKNTQMSMAGQLELPMAALEHLTKPITIYSP